MKNLKKLLLPAGVALLGIFALASCEKKPQDDPDKPDTPVTPVDPTPADEPYVVPAAEKFVVSVDEKPAAESSIDKSASYYQGYTRLIYVVPTGGKYDGDGTTPETALDFSIAIMQAQPGDCLLLAQGAYKYTSRMELKTTGENGKMITVKPLTESSRVVFDFSGMIFAGENRGIQIYGDFWHFLNIEVTGAGDNGMYIAGSHNIIENCSFYNNRDSGLQLGRAYSEDTTIDSWPSYNLIKNCTSFANYDDETYGENADGFAAKLTIGYGNIFDGCISFRNSDDGWDLYAKADSGNIGSVIMYNCVAYENGFLPYAIQRADDAGHVYLSYDTRDGDGIGFKCGGGVMEGDVVLENCLSFNNKLHGFGDNSNPGTIKIKNCTAVNNCAGIERDEKGQETGKIAAKRGLYGATIRDVLDKYDIIVPEANNKSNNFDLARDTNSYNSYYGLVSYISNQKGFDPEVGDSSYNGDQYRGSVAYSVFQTKHSDEGEVYVSFSDWTDASIYKNVANKIDPAFGDSTAYEGMADTSFASLESINSIVSSITKLSDLLSVNTTFRNADKSINMHDTCKIVDEKLLTFANGSAIGANLTKETYDSYNHYELPDLADCGTDEDKINVESAYSIIEILAAPEAIYQDFELIKFVAGCDVKWTSSDTSVIKINYEETISASKSVYSNAHVITPAQDTEVVLTAYITSGEVTKAKEFTVVVKNRPQTLGRLVSTGETSIRLEMYAQFAYPRIYPLDAASNAVTELPSALYTLTTKYEWAVDGNSKFVEVDNVYTSVAGVYKVTTTATLKSDTSVKETYTYKVYVVDPGCSIDFIDNASDVVLNDEGFTISGNLSNIYGDVYALVSATKQENITAAEILANSAVQSSPITADTVAAEFKADNTTGSVYYVYYIVSSHNKAVSSKVYSFETAIVDVSTTDDLYKLATKGKLSDSASPTTIYNLKNDLDFSSFTWTIPASGNATFTGLFNGNGYTIKNVTIDGQEGATNKYVNLFYKVSGTITNVKFDNIKIWGSVNSTQRVGIIGTLNGGYVSHVALTNVSVKGCDSVGALVAQVTGKDNVVRYCSLVNPIVGNTLIEQNANNQYPIVAGKKYASGLVGNVQIADNNTYVSIKMNDCYVSAVIGDGKDSGGFAAGILARIKNDSEYYYTTVERCVFDGLVVAKGNYNAGIVGGFESNAGTQVIVRNNLARCSFIFAGTVLNAKDVYASGDAQKYPHKNTNCIVGRYTTFADTPVFEAVNNYGSFVEYNSKYIGGRSLIFNLSSETDDGEFIEFKLYETFVKKSLKLDIENVWSFNEETQELKLK